MALNNIPHYFWIRPSTVSYLVQGSHLLPDQLPVEHTGHKAASRCSEPVLKHTFLPSPSLATLYSNKSTSVGHITYSVLVFFIVQP